MRTNFSTERFESASAKGSRGARGHGHGSCRVFAALISLALGSVGGCDDAQPSEQARPTAELTERSGDGGLQVLPHEAELAPGQALQVVLDTRDLEPKDGTYNLFLETVGAEAEFHIVDIDGEVVAESELYAIVEGDESSDHPGEVYYYARVELAGDNAAKMEVVAEVGEDVIEGNLAFCDEVVTNNFDGPPGSLRHAVAVVRDGGSVCFDPVEFGQGIAQAAGGGGSTIALGSAVSTTKSLTIRGLSANLPNPTTQYADRVFRFEGATALRSLLITEGEADEGGLVWASNALDMVGVRLRRGIAQNGGGLYVATAGSVDVRLDRSSVSDCTAAEDGGGIHYAASEDGGLFNPLHQDCEIAANTAGGRGGGIYQAGEHAGVYVALHGATTIVSNHADEDGGGVAGPTYARDSVSIVGNSAGRDGGGMWTEGVHSTFDLSRLVVVEGNIAGRDGGGIAIASDCGLGVPQCNASLLGRVRIADNVALRYGGGISMGEDRLKLVGFSNDTQGPLVTENSSNQGGGGGVYFAGAGELLLDHGGDVTANWPDDVLYGP